MIFYPYTIDMIFLKNDIYYLYQMGEQLLYNQSENDIGSVLKCN